MTSILDRFAERRAGVRRTALGVYATALAMLSAYVVLVCLVLAGGVVRLVAFDADRDTVLQAAQWGSLVAVAAGLVVSAIVVVVLHVRWIGVGGRVLERLQTAPASRDDLRLQNVTAELSLGLGVPPPAIRVIDDPAPNAVAAEDRGHPVVAVTRGAIDELPRDELEVLLAHELAQVSALDGGLLARAVTAVVTARRLPTAGYTVGAVAVALTLWAASNGVFLPTLLVLGIAIVVLSALTSRVLDGRTSRLVGQANGLGDLLAVELTRHPDALGHLLDRLAADDRRVAAADPLTGPLFFKLAAPLDESGDDADLLGSVDQRRSRASDDLRDRRRALARTVDEPPPAP